MRATQSERTEILDAVIGCEMTGLGLETVLDHLDAPERHREHTAMMIKQTTNPPVESFPVYKATDLTEGRDQARIQLGDQLYTLRITRAGKLILTK